MLSVIIFFMIWFVLLLLTLLCVFVGFQRVHWNVQLILQSFFYSSILISHSIEGTLFLIETKVFGNSCSSGKASQSNTLKCSLQLISNFRPNLTSSYSEVKWYNAFALCPFTCVFSRCFKKSNHFFESFHYRFDWSRFNLN